MAQDLPPAVAQTNMERLSTPIHHPLDPLSPDEILSVTHAIRHYIAAQTEIKAIKFITAYLVPPPKKAVLATLGIPLVTGEPPEKPTEIIRRAESDFLDVVNGCAYNVILAFKEQKWVIESLTMLEQGINPQISVEELCECEEVVKRDPTIIGLVKELGFEPEQIACDGWSIGYDDRFPLHRRVQQGLLFIRLSEHENFYAHPLDFIAVVDTNSSHVLHIDFPPRYITTPNGIQLSVDSTAPQPLESSSLSESKRDRIPIPLKSFDILPDLMEFKLRQDLKPLHVIQPEGVSFQMQGNVLEWQKWKMHIAFSHREGVVISTVTYNDDGVVRPLFYRMSLAEMVVPYGAPEWPHSRKLAFDTGEYGMGTQANDLSLGCDCLGTIHYLPGSFVKNDGTVHTLKHAICIHEEDSGILHKHTDYRPGGRSHAVRRRRLAVQMTCTLANYEYIWTYYFYQDGNIEFDVKLSGILQVYAKAPNEPTPFGTEVAPGVNAHYHQHLFSLRLDPMIDGIKNSVLESDILPIHAMPGSTSNFAGNGFFTRETVLKEETSRPYDLEKDRRWRIVNTTKKHYSTQKPVGYQFTVKSGSTPLLARPGSWIDKRAPFAGYPLWVCKANDSEDEGGGDNRLYPSGKYVPQTRDEPRDSVRKWVAGKENIEDEDILLFLTFGATHIPRPEDWPVMPVEELSIMFKPVGFFKFNPSMDVPPAQDSKSVFATGCQNCE